MQTQPWLTFSLDETLYCIPVSHIREVSPWSRPEPVPAAPAIVEGIINQRGDIVTVISGRRLLALDEAQSDDDTRIMTLELGQEVIGMTVDRVREIIELKESDIEPPPTPQAVLQGTCQVGEELVVALDVNYLAGLSAGGDK